MRLWSLAVRLASAVWLVVHFTLTALYVMPPNPINMSVQPLLATTIGTYFAQNWSLFAPDPIMADEALLVRCVGDGAAPRAPSEAFTLGAWYDVSTPFWKRFQRNRFSPYDRLVRAQSNAIRQFQGGSTYVSRWREACDRGSADACSLVDGLMRVERETAGAYLRRIACAFCLSATPSPERVVSVDLRLRETSPVPWSRRNEGGVTRKAADFDLASYPVERDVVKLSLFQPQARP